METSGNTLAHTYYELSRRPELQDELWAEFLKLEPMLKYPRSMDDGNELLLPSAKDIDSLETREVAWSQPRLVLLQPFLLILLLHYASSVMWSIYLMSL